MRLFHYSDRTDIAEFQPRPPERYPDAEPFVYAIDEWHSPLYLFPRNCPRIGLWPVDTTTEADLDWYRSMTSRRMLFLIDAAFETLFRHEPIVQYELDPAGGFVDCHDHGVWVSKELVRPVQVTTISDLAAALEHAETELRVEPSLIRAANQFYDFDAKQFTTSLHVSMVRMALLPDWSRERGKPVQPKDV